MIILIHTSKTMRPAETNTCDTLGVPVLIDKARELSIYAKSLSVREIEKMMHISQKLTGITRELTQGWTSDALQQRAAVDSFLGDIYSGLQISHWSENDRLYANEHLRILSGLYGILKPLDGIYPYRLEMGYKLPGTAYKDLYNFWGESIARTLPKDDMVIDLSAVEYGKTVTKYIAIGRVISPRFLTISPKTGEPVFVVVHAKIARGAFASWMIRNRIDAVEHLKQFNEIGYEYSEAVSTLAVPVFVCKAFKGIGLSVRLS